MDVTMNGLWVGILVTSAILVYQIIRMVLEVRRDTAVWLPLGLMSMVLGFVNPVLCLLVLLAANGLLLNAWLHHRGPFAPR